MVFITRGLDCEYSARVVRVGAEEKVPQYQCRRNEEERQNLKARDLDMTFETVVFSSCRVIAGGNIKDDDDLGLGDLTIRERCVPHAMDSGNVVGDKTIANEAIVGGVW